jgi:hypothetical protein
MGISGIIISAKVVIWIHGGPAEELLFGDNDEMRNYASDLAKRINKPQSDGFPGAFFGSGVLSSQSNVLRDVLGEPYCSFSGQCQVGHHVVSSLVNGHFGPCGCSYYKNYNLDKFILRHKEECRYHDVIVEDDGSIIINRKGSHESQEIKI